MAVDQKLTYKDAGVDTKEGERAVSLMKEHVKRTFSKNVLTGLGSFGSLYEIDKEDLDNPVLVSGADGVGTKLKIAFLMDKHDTVGIDCVAMCVNDVLCQGAKPMFFLDYIATGKVEAEKVAKIVSGVAEGCLQGECSLVGGETAEMPEFYQEGEYDMAGFAIGIVSKSKVITGEKISEGDAIIGVSSSGLHSNGFSLVRKVLLDRENMKVTDFVPELGETLGEALITPTKLYTKAFKAATKAADINGIVHITGGGFYENIPRVFQGNLGCKIKLGSWEMPKIFPYLMDKSGNSIEEMFSTFNMGVGMMFFVKAEDKEKVLAAINEAGENAFEIGEVISSETKEVILEGAEI